MNEPPLPGPGPSPAVVAPQPAVATAPPVAEPTPASTPAPAPTIDTLLPANAKPGADGMVDVGHLHVQPALYDRFREALANDAKNPDTVAMVGRLIDGPHDVNVSQISDKNADTRPRADGGANVRWNPDIMFVDGQGGRHSAGVILGHELDHADEYTHHPEQFAKDVNTPAGHYSNKEEQRVIDGWERTTSVALGEGVRTDHDTGAFVGARSVTSIDPVLHQTRDGRTSEVPSTYQQSGRIISIDANAVEQEIRKGAPPVSYPTSELMAIMQPNQPQVGDTLTVSSRNGEIHAVDTPSIAQPQAIQQGR